MIDLDKYTHVSFDLDGTLVRTHSDYRYQIVPRTIKHCEGNTGVASQNIDRFWFESERDSIIKEHFGIDPKAFWDAFCEFDTVEWRSSYTHAYEDAEPALRRLSEMRKHVSIITGAPDWIARMEIEKLNGAPYDHHISLRHGEHPLKPDPASMFATLEHLSVQPHETLYVGNSNEDAVFAKNAGCNFVYVERREHIFENTAWMIAVIESLDELFS